MSVIVFSQNDKNVGVFDDKKVFKSKSFHFILDTLINKGYFKTKKQCGMKIKDDLKILYEDSDYAFTYKDIKFSKTVFVTNELEIVKIEKKTDDNVFVVYTIDTLNSPLEMLDVTEFYNKNE
jgi:hypothetical protein